MFWCTILAGRERRDRIPRPGSSTHAWVYFLRRGRYAVPEVAHMLGCTTLAGREIRARIPRPGSSTHVWVYPGDGVRPPGWTRGLHPLCQRPRSWFGTVMAICSRSFSSLYTVMLDMPATGPPAAACWTAGLPPECCPLAMVVSRLSFLLKGHRPLCVCEDGGRHERFHSVCFPDLYVKMMVVRDFTW